MQGVGLQPVESVAGPVGVAGGMAHVGACEGAFVAFVLCGRRVDVHDGGAADDELIATDAEHGGLVNMPDGKGVAVGGRPAQVVAVHAHHAAAEGEHVRGALDGRVDTLPVGGVLEVVGEPAAPHAFGCDGKDAGAVAGCRAYGLLDVVGVEDDGVSHIYHYDADVGGEVCVLAKDAECRHGDVLAGAVFQLCEVHDVVVVVDGEEVDVAVVIHEDDALGLGAVVHQADVDVVELVQAVEGGDALVVGVIGHQLPLHEGIHLMADGYVLCGCGI